MNQKTKELLKQVIQILDDRIEAEERIQLSRLKEHNAECEPYDMLLARAPVVKDFYFALSKAKEYIEKEHQKELRFSKRDIFPYKWMLKNKGIESTLNKCPLICPLLNYLHNKNRYIKGEEFSGMKENNRLYLDGARHNDKHEYSTFVGNQAFYEELAVELEVSVPTIKKHFQALCEAGILKKWKKGRVWLYADGYFVETSSNSKTKRPFLKDSSNYRKALKCLEVW
jgi:predicted transcriptional regulator